MRKNYWSCSLLADWIRGTPKKGSKTSKGWSDWRQEAKTSHPIRYWIAEEGLNKIQNFLYWPLDKLYSAKYYINNRWVTKTHALTAHPRDIKPGEWQDVGNRFLPCMFNELVNFVEIELAWCHIAWDKEYRKKFKTPFWATGWFRWRTWRCPEAGLANLKWQKGLRWSYDEVGEGSPLVGEYTHQALAAKEIYELYKWWTDIYPNRPDPYDASGWTDYCNMRRAKGYGLLDFEDKNAEEEQLAQKALDLCDQIQEAYDREDEEMMIRLIRVRKSLWT